MAGRLVDYDICVNNRLQSRRIKMLHIADGRGVVRMGVVIFSSPVLPRSVILKIFLNFSRMSGVWYDFSKLR